MENPTATRAQGRTFRVLLATCDHLRSDKMGCARHLSEMRDFKQFELGRAPVVQLTFVTLGHAKLQHVAHHEQSLITIS